MAHTAPERLHMFVRNASSRYAGVLCVCVCMFSVYKDGAEVYNTSSSSEAAAAGAAAGDTTVVEASCVVGDKLSCGVILSDDEKQLHVCFSKNDQKVHLQSVNHSGLALEHGQWLDMVI